MRKRKKVKIGDVFAIPLPNGKFGFGRIYRDASIGIYNHIGIDVTDLPQKEEYQFVVGVYEDVLKSGNWELVDTRPFKNEEEEWPPPYSIKDPITGKYSIYHKGEDRISTEQECKGLEVAAVWEADHIIDRIMGDDKWHRSM